MPGEAGPRVYARAIPPGLRQRVLSGSVKFLRSAERMVKPRRTRWMSSGAARSGNALVMVLLAALPFPPLPPLTNSLPCYALIPIAASMMEEDGTLIWVGYAVALGTIFYLAFIVAALEQVVRRAYRWLSGLVSP